MKFSSTQGHDNFIIKLFYSYCYFLESNQPELMLKGYLITKNYGFIMFDYLYESKINRTQS